MHFHPAPDDLSAPPAYCVDHAPDDVPLYECLSDRHECVVCEEEAD